MTAGGDKHLNGILHSACHFFVSATKCYRGAFIPLNIYLNVYALENEHETETLLMLI